MTDSYEEQLSAARYRAERDQARQELERLREGIEKAERGYPNALSMLEDGPQVTMSAYDLLSEEERMVLNRWPRFEDGTPVRFGDDFLDHLGNVRSVLHIDVWQEGGFTIHTGQNTKDWHSGGECVRRPAVLAADGEPLEAGQAVWHVTTGHEYIVRNCTNGGANLSRDGRLAGYCRAEYLTHQRPVLDADGVPIKIGDVVYGIDGAPLDVYKIHRDSDPDEPEDTVWCGERTDGGISRWRIADQLTHTKPEPPDSWERIEEDAENIQCYADARAYVIDRGLMHINEETGDSLTNITVLDLVEKEEDE